MPFVKIVKNKAYFKRFQVQYRRRREGLTDYRARRQMVLQDKTKFGSPKYRLVVRISNTDIIAQIVQAKIQGDIVTCAAYSHELPAFGIDFGLTNYAAAYATGLLVARRVLTKLKIADKFLGVKSVTGEFTAVRSKDDDEDESRFPFRAILDVGLARTTTGARVFGVLKGAVDGGLAIPHKPTRFPGYNRKSKELNAKLHRDRIFGKHVADYLKKVSDEKQKNPDSTSPQFAQFIKKNIKPDALEAAYKKAHEAIRKEPTKTLVKAKKQPKAGAKKNYKVARKSKKEKRAGAQKKIAVAKANLAK